MVKINQMIIRLSYHGIVLTNKNYPLLLFQKSRSRHRKKSGVKIETNESQLKEIEDLHIDDELPFRVKKSDVMGR